MPFMIKGLATPDYILCVQLLQTDREYCASLQTSISSITEIYRLMHMRKLCVKCHSCEFLIVWIVNFKFLLKLRAHHSGK